MKSLKSILLQRILIFLGLIFSLSILIELYNISNFVKHYKERSLEVTTIFADYFEPTLLFDSKSDFQSLTNKFDFENRYLGVTLYDEKGDVFSSRGELVPLDQLHSIEMFKNKMVTKVDVNTMGRKIGTLVIAFRIDDLKSEILKEIVVSLIVFAILLLIFALHVRTLSNEIVKPINSITQSVLDFMVGGHFHYRDDFVEIKETSDLKKSFREMLSQLDRSKRELERLNEKLEDKVEEKTKELSSALEETKKFQEKVIAQEKLASLGSLSAGIAHELKNPLNLINNSAIIVKTRVEDVMGELKEQLQTLNEQKREEILDDLNDIVMASDIINESGIRSDRIIKSMLSQARSEHSELSKADLSEICRRAINLSYHAMRAKNDAIDIQLEENIAENVELYCYPDEVERALINIIDNAIDALKEKKSRNKEFVPTLNLTLKCDDSEVIIGVRDNGVGIKKDVLDKVREPFFTTKPAGKGTGLGMSMVNDIVRSLNGDIFINSEENEFTYIEVCLRTGEGESYAKS